MNPFVYPKSRHIRQEKPGELSPYTKYKPFLRQEFERKCIYCRMPDSMKDQESFGVEHYRPKSEFPELITSYPNLFYACNPCNRRKGSSWLTGKIGKTHFVPNPCDHEMFKHLRFTGPTVEAKSPAGEWTAELLDLNDPGAVEYRTFILDAVRMYLHKKMELERTRLMLLEMREQSSVAATAVDAALAQLESGLATVRTHLQRLAGD